LPILWQRTSQALQVTETALFVSVIMGIIYSERSLFVKGKVKKKLGKMRGVCKDQGSFPAALFLFSPTGGPLFRVIYASVRIVEWGRWRF